MNGQRASTQAISRCRFSGSPPGRPPATGFIPPAGPTSVRRGFLKALARREDLIFRGQSLRSLARRSLFQLLPSLYGGLCPDHGSLASEILADKYGR